MKFKADEIASLIQKEIENFTPSVEKNSDGVVVEVGDGIARVSGLSGVMAGEMVKFSNGVTGLALNLEENSVGVVILGDYLKIQEGSKVTRTENLLQTPVGEQLCGRVVDPLGNPLDGAGSYKPAGYYPVERPAPGIADRQPVCEPLQTGIKAIDAMTPIGRGQRELIIGDRKTGKTQIGLDTIINQRGKGVKCFYVAIGQKDSTVAQAVKMLETNGAMEYTTVVVAGASSPASLQYIAPYAGTAMAEYFMDKGEHALIVYDDLSKQAAAYRELSLLLRRAPGREAYPGDVFYCHSRLLERSAKLSVEKKGGSLTSLPIIETQEGEVSAYIPTNVISITDGQIYLQPDLFFKGQRPAMNIGISVSRVGGSAQVPAMKQVAGGMRLDLAAFRELEAFAQFGSDVDAVTKRSLTRGYCLNKLLIQGVCSPLDVVDQILIIYAGTKGYVDSLPLDEINRWESEFLDWIHREKSSLCGSISSLNENRKKMDNSVINEIEASLNEFNEKVFSVEAR